jgi:hypothetical protein
MKPLNRKRKWAMRLVMMIALVVLALPLSKKFDTTPKELAAQRAELSKRDRTAEPSRVDSAVLLADVRTLADPAMQGRAVNTPGAKKARDYLLQRFSDVGLEPVGPGFEHPFSFTPGRGIRFWRAKFWQERKPVPGVNLVGQIRGTVDPDSVIVVSAHYDHLGLRRGKLYPGADDNASGVAAMLAIARHFRANPPRHTLLFVAFDAEESGLKGALAFVENPPVPLKSILLNVNFDMVSRNDAGEIFASGLHANPQLRPMLDKVRADSIPTILYGHDKPGFYRVDEDWTMQSDQGAFHQRDIPFLYFGVADHDDYHSPGDTFAHIQPKFFISVADALIDVVAALDGADAAQLRRNGGGD